MNNSDLIKWCEENGVDTVEALNLLQYNGIVSDNCIYLDDVADADVEGAIEFLKAKAT